MKVVQNISALGLCEHCGTLVSLATYSEDEGMDAQWNCICGKELTHLSFGYDRGDREAKKVRWVGPDGKWTKTKPTADFELGNIQVMVKMPTIF